jgi:hypothetical protein
VSSDPPSGAPGHGDVDQRTWNKGVIVATILAAFIIGFIVALATNTSPTTNNPAPSATGQDSKRAPVAK